MKNRRWNGSLPNTTRVDPAIVKYARPLTAHSKRGNSATIGCGKTFLNRRGAAGGYVVYPVVANVRGMMRYAGWLFCPGVFLVNVIPQRGVFLSKPLLVARGRQNTIPLFQVLDIIRYIDSVEL